VIRRSLTLLAGCLVLAGCGQHGWVDEQSAGPGESVAVVESVDPTEAPGTVPAALPTLSAETADAEAPPPLPPAAATAQPAATPASSRPDGSEQPERPTPRPSPTAAPSEPDHGAPLWNRNFVAVRVTKHGRERPLVADTELRIHPHRRSDGRDVLRWHAGCNTFGGDLQVTEDRFDVSTSPGSTAVGCSEAHYDQENWFTAFLEGDPRWRLSDDRKQLTLRGADAAIVFEQRAWDPRW